MFQKYKILLNVLKIDERVKLAWKSNQLDWFSYIYKEIASY